MLRFMNNQILDSLLEEYVLYSQVQEKVAQAILDCDETTVMALELEGRQILGRLEPKLSQVVSSVAGSKLRQKTSPEGFQSLVQSIEKSQAQLSRNQDALSYWKREVGTKLLELSSPGEKGPLQEFETNSGSGTAGGFATSPFPGVVPGNPTWGPQGENIGIGEKFDRLS